MTEYVQPEAYSGLSEFEAAKQQVMAAFTRIFNERYDHPSNWKPFDGSTVIGMECHRIFAEEVVVSALPHNDSVTPDLIKDWYENGVTPDQLRAYGEIAVEACSELGYPEEGLMASAYIHEVVDINYSDFR